MAYARYLRAAHKAWQRVLARQFDVAAALAALLHSWNQWQLIHLHVHTVWPSIGWSLSDPDRLVEIDPARVDQEDLIKTFGEALLDGLCRVAERGLLVMTGQAAFLESGAAFCDWIQDLERREWVLRPQPPLDGGQAALGYLARYIRGVAIGNRRILEFDPDRGTVLFEYRDNESGPHGEDVIRRTTIPAVEFIRRYLEHVMPKGMGRGRFYGWWSGSKKGKELPRIRVALDVPQEEPEAAEQYRTVGPAVVGAFGPERLHGTRDRQINFVLDAFNALARADAFDEIKEIRDKAEALRKYAQDARAGLQLQNRVAELRLRAARRAGRLLRSMALRGSDRKSDGQCPDLSLTELGLTH